MRTPPPSQATESAATAVRRDSTRGNGWVPRRLIGTPSSMVSMSGLLCLPVRSPSARSLSGEGTVRPMASPDRVAAVLEPFVRRPERAAVVTDFDGTLAPIVTDPAAARPLAVVPDLLRRLAARFARVAVVSGRPAAFLLDHLGAGGVSLHGIY